MDVVEENDRIYLREVLPEDWAAFQPYSSNEETVKYQPWGPNTPDDCKFFVRQAMLDRMQRHRGRFVFVIVEKSSGAVVGNIEMNIRDWDGVGEVGFIIHQDRWGEGFATEATLLMLNYCFVTCELHRVVATSSPQNLPSIRVLEKIGMIKEGMLRKDLLIKGEWRDSLVYSMLREEWNEENEKNAKP
ncbi:GNAT family N-acetyltransferase [Halobacillus litoralis]|uniref:GNAT family N-acetyltransferase n=1 Tax=Halobacillus litoralis TaxID=45668 RepID=UPI0024929C55|nr:GNAT family protein [Halobacillus litoralis]